MSVSNNSDYYRRSNLDACIQCAKSLVSAVPRLLRLLVHAMACRGLVFIGTFIDKKSTIGGEMSRELGDGSSMRTKLVCNASHMTIQQRNLAPRLVAHSNQGG